MPGDDFAEENRTLEEMTMSEGSIVSFEASGPVTVATVRTTSVLDAANVGQFGHELQKQVRAHPGTHLLLDFERVEYLSSAVLTELLRTKKALAETKGTIRLCALTAEIKKVFEITNLDQIFPIETDLESALPRYLRAIKVAQEEANWKPPA